MSAEEEIEVRNWMWGSLGEGGQNMNRLLEASGFAFSVQPVASAARRTAARVMAGFRYLRRLGNFIRHLRGKKRRPLSFEAASQDAHRRCILAAAGKLRESSRKRSVGGCI
jgi:hypothetical protein